MLNFLDNAAPSRLTDRDGLALVWRITVREDGSHSIEQSDFALQNYLSHDIITTRQEAIDACNDAENRIRP